MANTQAFVYFANKYHNAALLGRVKTFYMRFLILLPWLWLLTGCASPSLTLINERGDTVRCAATGSLQSVLIAENMVNSCLNDYKKIGFIPAPQVFIGMRLSDWRYPPAQVTEIAPSSPASEGNIFVGDRIISMDGHPISTGWDVIRILSAKNPYDSIQLVTERDGILTQKKIFLPPKNGH